MKQKQRGMTMLGFLMVLCLGIFFAFCAMKIVPMYMEYYAVKEALKGLANDPELKGAPKDQIRKMYMRRLDMSYAEHVKKMDKLKIENTEGGFNLIVDYERRESLFVNLDVVGKFHTEQLLGHGGN